MLDSIDYGRVNWQSIEYEEDDCQGMYEEDRFESNNRQNQRWEEKKRLQWMECISTTPKHVLIFDLSLVLITSFRYLIGIPLSTYRYTEMRLMLFPLIEMSDLLKRERGPIERMWKQCVTLISLHPIYPSSHCSLPFPPSPLPFPLT